jgi:signal peptidase
MALKPGPLRDAVVLIVVFGVLLGGLYVYTGTWPPAVIVESSSMMHRDSEVRYGRIGTIDPGDLVLVKAVKSVDDVRTLSDGGGGRYGMDGDVVIYFPDNDHGRTPIIHRAVGYVEVNGTGSGATYRLRWNADKACEGGSQKDGLWCVYDDKGVYAPSVSIRRPGSTEAQPIPYKPEHTGFLTKGDNPVTNQFLDQVSGLSPPVKLEWIQGKGRGELPWLGLIKLALAGRPNEHSPPSSWVHIGSAYAPKDLWTMLGVSLFVLVGVPLIYDGYKAVQARRGKMGPPPAPHDVRAVGGPGSVTVSWAAAPRAATYKVYRGPNVVGETPETSFSESGLASGLSYVYVVAAVDADGQEGPKSHTASASPTDEGTPPGVAPASG